MQTLPSVGQLRIFFLRLGIPAATWQLRMWRMWLLRRKFQMLTTRPKTQLFDFDFVEPWHFEYNPTK